MVQIENLSKSYPMGKTRLEVLKGISLHIQKGELVSIMGASGSGKSTLLNIIGLLDDYDSGRYFLDDVSMERLPQAKAAYYRREFFGFVFQSFHLLPFKTARENVALPLYYKKVPRDQRNRIALDYLERVGLQDRADHLPAELSGGQCQRVALARALISDPKVILADEPTGALDSKTSQDIMEMFRSINRGGMTFIIVTHEKSIAETTDRIIRIRDGRIEGTSHV